MPSYSWSALVSSLDAKPKHSAQQRFFGESSLKTHYFKKLEDTMCKLQTARVWLTLAHATVEVAGGHC
jgi:hypothetical protein